MTDIAVSYFVQQWEGRKCCSPDCDPPDTICECVALAAEFCCVTGRPHPSGPTAAELAFPAGWVAVPIGQAQPGDLVQWDRLLPGSDGAGHVAVYVANLSTGFQSFDQNWSVPTCELVSHDYQNVVCAWRYSPTPPPPPHLEEGDSVKYLASSLGPLVFQATKDGHLWVNAYINGAWQSRDLSSDALPLGAVDAWEDAGGINAVCPAADGQHCLHAWRNPQDGTWTAQRLP